MKDSSYVRHRRQMDDVHDVQPVSPESSEPMELEAAVERSQEASAVAIYSKGFDSSLTDEIREEIKNGDGSTFFFDSETEMFPWKEIRHRWTAFNTTDKL